MSNLNSRFGQPPDDHSDALSPLPPDLDALARRLAADGAAWQRHLPDPVRVADRIRAIPQTAARAQDERVSPMSTPLTQTDQQRPAMPPPGGRPPQPRRWRVLVAGLAAALIVVLLAVVLAELAGRHGTPTTPAGQPTSTVIPTTPPTATSTPVPTATATAVPASAWTTIQAYTGSGNYTSGPFNITSPWRLVWQCNINMGNPGPYPLVVTVAPSAGPGGGQPALNTTCQAGNLQGTSAQQTAPTGLVRLSVTSAGDGEWDVRVQVVR